MREREREKTNKLSYAKDPRNYIDLLEARSSQYVTYFFNIGDFWNIVCNSFQADCIKLTGVVGTRLA